MTTFLRGIGSAIFALTIIAIFAVVAVIIIIQTLSDSAPQDTNQALTYLWNGLTVFVGGIVAAGFGLRLPGPNDPPGGGTEPLAGLGTLASTDQGPLRRRTAIGGAYALIYVLFGIFAVVIWAFKGNATTEMVREFAVAFIGIALPIAAMYFKN